MPLCSLHPFDTMLLKVGFTLPSFGDKYYKYAGSWTCHKPNETKSISGVWEFIIFNKLRW